MLCSPKIDLSATTLTPGLEIIDRTILQELKVSFIESPLALNPLRAAPKLQHLILKECSGLMISEENFETLNFLKQKGVLIELEGMPAFQTSYAAYCASPAASSTLTQTLAAATADNALLQDHSEQAPPAVNKANDIAANRSLS